MMASDEGQIDFLGLLLSEPGTDTSAVNDEGTTAMHLGAQQGHADVVHALLLAGACSSSVNNNGETPRDLAAGDVRVLQALEL